jgi:putative phosphoesterase
MKIAIVSDTHDQTDNVVWAVAELRRRGVATVLHCGDVTSPETAALFGGLDGHFVFGNCDWDRSGLERALAEAGATLHGAWGQLELAGRKLAFLHGDDGGLWQDIEHSGHFDYLFHGHTHVAADRMAGPTRVINPGALQRARVKTFVVLDLATGQAESVVVPEQR